MKRLLALVFLVITIQGCAGGGEAIKEGMRLEGEGRKVDALNVYEQSLKELGTSPSNSSNRDYIEGKAQSLKTELTDAALSEAAKAYGKTATITSVSEAVRVLEHNLQFDDSGNRLQDTLKKYNSILAELRDKQTQRLKQSDAAATQNSWSEATRLLDEAIVVEPSPALSDRRKKLIADRDAYYKAEFGKALSRQDWAAADKLMENICSEAPAMNESTVFQCKADLAKLKEKVVEQSADDLVSQGKFYTAYMLLSKANMPAASGRLSEIGRTGSEFYKSLAVNEMNKGADGVPSAYLAVVKALVLDPQAPDLFELHRDLQDRVEQLIKVQIAVSTFDSPASDPNAGRSFSDELISYLVKHLPYGIDVLERSKIDVLLKESGIELKDVSRQLGAKLFIIGNVNELTIEHKRYDSKDTVEGFNESTEYITTMTERGQPIQVPVTKRVPVDIQYNKGFEKVRGAISLSVRIFDAEKGSIAFAEQFKASNEVEDKFQEGVNKAHVEIKEDPLVLPADGEIRDKIMGDVVDKVAGVVLKLFELREWRFWERVKLRMDRREHDQAVAEAAQGYLYCIKENLPDDNEWYAKIRQAALTDLTE